MRSARSVRTPQRRGITAVVAMLFMILFSTLALGFYATVTTAVSLTKNDVKGAKARLAAESGVQFMRYHLAHASVPPNTPSGQILTQLYNDLVTELEDTGNLGSGTVGMNGNIITIPAEAGKYIITDTTDNSGFKVTITEWSGNIVCKVSGMTGNGSSISTKAVSLDFKREPIPTDIFDYAIASKGKVLMKKGSILGVTGISSNSIASILSAKTSGVTVQMTGGTVGGELSSVADNGVVVTGGSVSGSSNITTIYANYVNDNIDPPDFPTFDTDIFEPYATSTYSSGTTLKNIRIPANTNPKFTGGATIQGILYIESPNTVEFRGNVKLQGFIVFEDSNDSSVNILDMRGNFSHAPLPNGSEFDPLRAITGVAVMAPTAHLTMSGSTDSEIKGNVILEKFTNGGSADIKIDQGTIITMLESGDAAVFDGKTVKFTSTGQDNQPTMGVSYSEHYVPVNGSYLELNE